MKPIVYIGGANPQSIKVGQQQAISCFKVVDPYRRLENHIAMFFLSKRIFLVFLSITGFCQIRYFSNIRVPFFQQHVEKYGFITG